MAKRSSEEMDENLDASTAVNVSVVKNIPAPSRSQSSKRWNNRQRIIFKVQIPPESPLSARATANSIAYRNSSYTSNTSARNFGSFMPDDMFCHMMGFVVSGSGEVDGETVKSMSVVCKQWHRLVNTPSVWAPSCSISHNDDGSKLQTSSSSSAKTISSSILHWRDTTSSDFSKTLIGFRKISEELSSFFRDDSDTYRVAERSSNRVYMVRIVKQDSQQQQETMFRHIAHTHQILGDDHRLFQSSDEHPSTNGKFRETLLFPLSVVQCHESSRMVVWYDNSEQTLDEWFEATASGVPLEQVKLWCHQLLTASALLEDTCLISAEHTVNMILDKNSTRLRLLVPECRIESTLSELLASEAYDRNIISPCVRLARLGGKGDLKNSAAISEAECPDLLIREFISFLLNKEHRPSIREAMAHPFLNSLKKPPQVPSMMRRMIAMEMPVETERRCVEPNEWATLADWQLEVCRVLGEKTYVVFRAMSYFDTVICKTVVTPSQYQLYAGACLHIASKSFGDRFISARDVAFCADNSFEEEEVKLTEQVVLEQIQWRLAPPTMLGFARAYVSIANMQPAYGAWGNTCSIMSHLALETQLLHSYPPSVCGAAAVVVASYIANHRPLWPDVLQKETGLTRADLQAPVSALCANVHLIRETAPTLTMLAAFPVPQAIDLQNIL